MDQSTTESTSDEMTFFFGAAGGSAQKALRTLGEPTVMLSYRTKNNHPWDGIETLGPLALCNNWLHLR